MTKFLNISTDNTLGGNAPSDELVVSQKAIKEYVDSQAGGGSGSGRNIGDIFYTTRTDTALSGAVECNGGTYNTADYTGEGSIGELLAGGNLPYVSLAEYATLLSTNGAVGVFGWDGGSGNWYAWTDFSFGGTVYTKTLTNPDIAYDYPEDGRIAGSITSSTSTTITVHRLGTYTRDSSKDVSGTIFRVPTLKDVFIECGQASELGDYVSAGLPNITGNVNGVSNRSFYSSPTADGAFYVDSYGNNAFAGGGGVGSNSALLHFNASRSSSIYGNSNTVQPKAIKYRAMVQLFNSTTDEAVATVGTVVAQVGVLNSHRVIDFQIPTAENNYTWYRKYADGWVEQGGRLLGSGNDWDANITYPIAMANSNYILVCQAGRNDGSGSGINNQAFVHTYNTTGFVADLYGDGTTTIMWWCVSGLSAN